MINNLYMARGDVLTSKKANGISTVFMECYVLVQHAYYTSTPTTLRKIVIIINNTVKPVLNGHPWGMGN